ncbi:AMP-binding protein [Micromonospora sp. M12]
MRQVLRACRGLRLTNGYGPTENTTFTTTYSVEHADATPDPLPIGAPVYGTDLSVVDASGRLVPPGAVGELLAGGTGLADGYLGDPTRTDASFVRHDGERRYRTGDLVRWGTDGQLRFLGRNDRQVKIAGHRVEPVDVERRLRRSRASATPWSSPPVTRRAVYASARRSSPTRTASTWPPCAARWSPTWPRTPGRSSG